MNFHVIALHRSGSKDLTNSLAEASNNALTYADGMPLAEYFHAWPSYGVKYPTTATSPSDHRTTILKPDFYDGDGVSFLSTYNPELKAFEYKQAKVRPGYDSEIALHLGNELMTAYRDSGKSIVIKSHLSVLSNTTMFASGGTWDTINNVITDINRQCDMFKIGLYRRDVTEWAMSRYLCAETGLYIPGEQQKNAMEHFLQNPITFNINSITRCVPILDDHFKYISEHCNYVVATEDLTEDFVVDYFSQRTDKPVQMRKSLEFAAGDYSKMIANYDQVVRVCNDILVPRIKAFEAWL